MKKKRYALAAAVVCGWVLGIGAFATLAVQAAEQAQQQQKKKRPPPQQQQQQQPKGCC